MPRIVAYIKEMLEEEKYGSAYIEKLPVRLKELNAAQLHGMYTHLQKIKKGAHLRMWENANGDIMTRMEAELTAKRAVVEAKQKKKEEQLRKLREARAVEKAKVVEANRVLENIIALSRERAINEVKEEEYKRKADERIVLMHKTMLGEQKQKRLIIGGTSFLVISIIIIAVVTNVSYIIAGAVFFVVCITITIYYFAYRAPIFEPLVVTEEEIAKKTEIRAEDLRLKALNELQRKEDEYNARALREKQELRKIRQERRQAKEAEAVARLAELTQSRRSLSPSPIGGRSSPEWPSSPNRDNRDSDAIQHNELKATTTAAASSVRPAPAGKSVKFGDASSVGSGGASGSASGISGRAVGGAHKVVTSIDFNVDSIRFYEIDFNYELKMNLLGLICLIENRRSGARYVSDISFYDDLADMRNQDIDFREEISEVTFSHLTEYANDTNNANGKYMGPIVQRFERMYCIRHGIPLRSNTGRVAGATADPNAKIDPEKAENASLVSGVSSSSSLTGVAEANKDSAASSSNLLSKNPSQQTLLQQKSTRMDTQPTESQTSSVPPSSDSTPSTSVLASISKRLGRLFFGEPQIVPILTEKPDLSDYSTKSQRMKFTPKPVIHKIVSSTNATGSSRSKKGASSTGAASKPSAAAPLSSKANSTKPSTSAAAIGNNTTQQHNEGQKWSIGNSAGGRPCIGIPIRRDDVLKLSLFAIHHDLQEPEEMTYSVVCDYTMGVQDLVDGLIENVSGLANKNIKGANKKSYIQGDLRRINMFLGGSVLLTATIDHITSEVLADSGVEHDPQADRLGEEGESDEGGPAAAASAAAADIDLDSLVSSLSDGYNPFNVGENGTQERAVAEREQLLDDGGSFGEYPTTICFHALSLIDFRHMQLAVPPLSRRDLSFGRAFDLSLYCIVHLFPQHIEYKSEVTTFNGIYAEEFIHINESQSAIDIRFQHSDRQLIPIADTQKITVLIYYQVNLSSSSDSTIDSPEEVDSDILTGKHQQQQSVARLSSDALSSKNEILPDGSLLAGAYVCHSDDIVLSTRAGATKADISGVLLSASYEPVCRLVIDYSLITKRDELI